MIYVELWEIELFNHLTVYKKNDCLIKLLVIQINIWNH